MRIPESHESYMQRALALAQLGMGATRPNPMVGAVIVRSGRIVGEGYHEVAGGPHAEAAALRHAGDAAQGATMYVTLEPCHHHGRTPPCTQAILDAGIERVFFATRDRNPNVEGGGAAFLRTRGVACIEGPLTAEAAYLNRGFLRWAARRRPWVVAKFAASLDGKIATHTGESRWITGPEARGRGHELRNEVDAILVGAGTVMADDPQLTVRVADVERQTSNVERRSPSNSIVRIVVDSRGRSTPESKVFATADGAETLVATTASSPEAWREALTARGAAVITLPSDESGRVDLVSLLKELGRREIRSLLVEGGPTMLGSFFDGGLVDEVFAFLAPIVIGGADAPGAVGGEGVGALQNALRLESVEIEPCGSDVLVRGITKTSGVETPSADRFDHTRVPPDAVGTQPTPPKGDVVVQTESDMHPARRTGFSI